MSAPDPAPGVDPVRARDPRAERLLAAARDGDLVAFEAFVEPLRRELRAHCYRILGSVHDADDALQDAMLGAWRGIGSFDGRSSLRGWLHRVAANAAIDATRRRERHRVLPFDEAAASTRPQDIADEPREESVPWLEPFPSGAAAADPTPHGRAERRESLELAFVAALQHLPPNQRAALVLRDVLDFSAEETAEALGTSVPSVTSALQRARETARLRLPERTQQQTLAEVGDEHVRTTVGAYMTAMDHGDVDGIVALLSEDATWSMPPMNAWFAGTDAIRTFLTAGPLTQSWRRRDIGEVNGQPASAAWMWDHERQAFCAYAIDVFTFDGPRIAAVTAFLQPSLFGVLGLPDVIAD